jgi:hypothetical protein
MVVVFSSNANRSDHIRREVERAVFRGVGVIPVRIEDVLPQGDLEYFLSASHWLDAITPPLERHFEELATNLRILLIPEPGPSSASSGRTNSQTPPPRTSASKTPPTERRAEAGVSAATATRWALLFSQEP